MKIDITSMFFNSDIVGQTATPAWRTALGQSKTNSLRIKTSNPGVTELLVGMTYCAQHDLTRLNLNGASGDVVTCSLFTKLYINGQSVGGSQYVMLIVRDNSTTWNGRLQLCYSPRLAYNDIDNNAAIERMFTTLGCSQSASLFVYDITIENQDELHFSAVILDKNAPKSYTCTSTERSEQWKQLAYPTPPNRSSSHLQKIYFGTPGGGKSQKVKKLIEDRGAEERSFRTTFHPDTDYASFVGCYKPVMDGDKIKYEFVPQVFTRAYVAAWNDPANDYYLVIEEINRGNCAQIFGDLFQLLDRKNGVSEYPILADTDLRKYLEGTIKTEDGSEEDVLSAAGKDGIKKGELRLPSNLSILATMNTSDQSLFPMDSAFKRRWDWEFVPSDNCDENDFRIYINEEMTRYILWADFRNEVNKKIFAATESEDKQMGAFFIKSDIGVDELRSKVMFYLWSEVCKENFHTSDNFFRMDKEGQEEFSFNCLFSDNGKIIERFCYFLGIKIFNDNEYAPEATPSGTLTASAPSKESSWNVQVQLMKQFVTFATSSNDKEVKKFVKSTGLTKSSAEGTNATYIGVFKEGALKIGKNNKIWYVSFKTQNDKVKNTLREHAGSLKEQVGIPDTEIDGIFTGGWGKTTRQQTFTLARPVTKNLEEDFKWIIDTTNKIIEILPKDPYNLTLL